MSYVVKTFVTTELEENCYLLSLGTEALIIDPGGDADIILDYLARLNLTLKMILNTHGHIDHIGANAEIREATGAPIGVHALDAPMLESSFRCGAEWLGWDYREHKPDFLFSDGDSVGFESISFRVLHTPGHSPGSCGLIDEINRNLFGGDLIFQGSVGRWDLPGGDRKTLLTSIRDRILPLQNPLAIYPGHGPSTTLQQERTHNPYIGPLSQGADLNSLFA